MADLYRACKKALEAGTAEKASDTAIFFTGKTDLAKLASAQRSYGKAFRKRWEKRVEMEHAAEKELRDFVITF